MIEVTVYALVALFIFFRLYLALGKNADEQKFNNSEKIIDVLEEKSIIEDTFAYVSREGFSSIVEQINILRVHMPNFSSDFFIKGAEKAFDVILAAFYDEDIKTLKMLLTKEILQQFVHEIEKRKSQSVNHKKMIVAIDSKEIISVRIMGGEAFIHVKFISEQIQSDNPENLEMIPRSEHVEDHWEFVKKLNSSDNKWILCAIK